MENNDGWNEWKRHILIQLDRISEFIESSIVENSLTAQKINQVNLNAESKIQDLKNEITTDLNDIRRDVAKVNTLVGSKNDTIDMLTIWKKENDDTSIIDTVKDLKLWKTDRESLLPNSQIEDKTKKIEETEKFKTRIVTIYIVIQTLILLILGLMQAGKL